jgi:hypothetical protein
MTMRLSLASESVHPGERGDRGAVSEAQPCFSIVEFSLPEGRPTR